MSSATSPHGAEQRGIIRTNCIDSLDRTNAAQFCIGKVVLGHQMFMLGVSDTPQVPFDDDVMGLLMSKFEHMGNQVALQYGGSQLAHTMKAYQGKDKNLSRDLITTARRFYNNSFTDFEKQMAINLFLGKYVPWREREKLWELETDYHRHMSGPCAGSPAPLSSTAWWEQPLQSFKPASALAARMSSHRQRPDRMFEVVYRTARLSQFDKMLLQRMHVLCFYSRKCSILTLPNPQRTTALCGQQLEMPRPSQNATSTSKRTPVTLYCSC